MNDSPSRRFPVVLCRNCGWALTDDGTRHWADMEPNLLSDDHRPCKQPQAPRSHPYAAA